MVTIILGALLILGFFLLFLNLKTLPIQEVLIIFLFASYIGVVLGTIAVEMDMLAYPAKLFDGKYFQSNLLFEMLLLPDICLFFYRTTLNSKVFQIIIQSVIYSGILTFIEKSLEHFTAFINYNTWTWIHTFISVALFLILTRIFIASIKKINE